MTTRVVIRSGQELAFALKKIGDETPIATVLVIPKNRKTPIPYLELGAGDVEAVLAILIRIRERQIA